MATPPRSVLAARACLASSQDGPAISSALLTIFYWMMGGGFFIAIAGHVFKSPHPGAIAGVMLIFTGTAVFMLAVGSYG